MNIIFIVLIAGAVLTAAFNGRMEAVNAAWVESAKFAVVTVALPLLGMMALWLGFMRVLQEAGVMRALARWLAPVMRRLFPEVPADHPAMGAMIMNMAANIMGMGNAATPFGLKAMQELKKLNARPGVASNSMVLFLAINTSGVAVFPFGVITIRASLDSADPGGIFIPSILATLCSTIIAIFVAKAVQGRAIFSPARFPTTSDSERPTDESQPAEAKTSEFLGSEAETSPMGLALLLIFFLIWAICLGVYVLNDPRTGLEQIRPVISNWLLPALMAFIVLFGFARGVKVYESLVSGAKEGFQIFVMIIPYLVAILVAVGMLRASGLLDIVIATLQPLTSAVGFPAEALPMALLRPLSGGGAIGVMTETMTTYGPDSFVGYLVSVMNGSTETTFYVLALYLGSIHVRAARHALVACLAADAAGVAAALFWCRLFF